MLLFGGFERTPTSSTNVNKFLGVNANETLE